MIIKVTKLSEKLVCWHLNANHCDTTCYLPLHAFIVKHIKTASQIFSTELKLIIHFHVSILKVYQPWISKLNYGSLNQSKSLSPICITPVIIWAMWTHNLSTTLLECIDIITSQESVMMLNNTWCKQLSSKLNLMSDILMEDDTCTSLFQSALSLLILKKKIQKKIKPISI